MANKRNLSRSRLKEILKELHCFGLTRLSKRSFLAFTTYRDITAAPTRRWLYGLLTMCLAVSLFSANLSAQVPSPGGAESGVDDKAAHVLCSSASVLTEKDGHWLCEPIPEIHQRTIERKDGFFVIVYKVQKYGFVTVPLTFPSGQAHHAAEVTVYKVVKGKKVAVAPPFQGEWTERGCFEDDPDTLVTRALEMRGKKKDG